MRFLIPLLLLPLLSFAQNDTQDPRYQPIFARTKATLEEHGYPVGRAGNAAYVPDQYVIMRFGGNATQQATTDLQNLQNQYGGRLSTLGQCGCQGNFQVNLIEIDSLGGEERGKRGKDKLENTLGHEEVTPNFYLFPEREQIENHPAFNQLPANFSVLASGKPAAPVDIAILDSGLDLRYQNPANTGGKAPLYLWENPAEISGGNDPFCYPGDLVGWDFVNNDAAPVDDHSHGTHVASRIAEQLSTNEPDVNYRFMSLKMLDQNGVGSSFTATCAVLYAAYHRADVINASWGFYGESDPVLRRAFAYAEQRGVTTMSSAGNERVDLAELLHYPSSYSLEQPALRSVLFISGNQQGSNLWPGTNYRTEGQAQGGFVAAPAFNQSGLVPMQLPGGNVQAKSGTSVSTPYATALAAHVRHLYPGMTAIAVRNQVLNAIRDHGMASSITLDGQTYPYYSFKWVDVR